jgi:hypothetical protein
MQRSINTPSDRKQDAAVQLRLGPIFEQVENWRRGQPKIPTRSEAVRVLLQWALEAKQRDVSGPSSA